MHTGPAVNAGPRPLLRIENLTRHFPIMQGVFRRQVGTVKAVDGLDFEIPEGETLGLVGESGCGKSTTGRVILRLHPATAGRIEFGGEDITALEGEALRRLRRRMQMIFQDPQDSLNPRMTAGGIVGEPLREHGTARGKALAERVEALFESVGLDPRFTNRYPHEFSGGQRQRIGVARALALDPEFIVCDEPIAALDVSIQAQVVNLLEDLQERLGLTYLFISHDLGMIPPHRGSGGGDVPRQDRRARPERRAVPRAAPPLYPGAALRGADPRPRARSEARAHHPHRRRAEPRGPAVRLPLQHPMPAGGAGVLRPRAGVARAPPRPPGRLPLRGVSAKRPRARGRRRFGKGNAARAGDRGTDFERADTAGFTT